MYESPPDKILNAYFHIVMPAIGRAMHAGDKDSSRNAINQITTFYYGLSCFLGPETMKEVDEVIKNIRSTGKTSGGEVLIKWIDEVLKPTMRDKNIGYMFTKKSIIKKKQ